MQTRSILVTSTPWLLNNKRTQCILALVNYLVIEGYDRTPSSYQTLLAPRIGVQDQNLQKVQKLATHVEHPLIRRLGGAISEVKVDEISHPYVA